VILYKGKSLHLAAGLSFSGVSSRQFLSGMQKLQITQTYKWEVYTSDDTVPGRGPAYTVTYLFCACFYAVWEPRNVL